uniref:B2 protein n=1 Tax=Noccaea caerulescens TaxID=107243 RepID=A0A1J3I4H3_NOCCA
MPKYRRMKLMEESNGASGEEPEYGAIFMSNNSTRKECLRRELFGLPNWQAGFVKQVKAGMLLFLFEFESRELHGVFQACSDGAINIEPDAFCSSWKQFPAQVKFTEMWHCRPLREMEFRDAISDNYFTATKFNFGLSKAQVQRLLKLFSLKKVERSQPRKTAVAKHTRKSASGLGNAAGDRDFGNRGAEDTDGDVDREFPFRVTSAGDRLGRSRSLKENYGFGDESDIGVETKGNEYSGDTSGVYRRLVDPKLHGSKDRVGYDFSMNNSFGTDALTNHSSYNDRGVPKNLRHTASGWSEKEYHEKDGITLASMWSNHEECLNFGADPSVPAQSSVPRGSRYGTNAEYYDPCDPGIPGHATMNSSRQGIGAPNVDSMGSAFYTGNSNHVSREEVIAVGGYVSDTLPSERVQPFSDEHNGTSMNKTSLGVDYYIPMPTEHPEYQTSTGMTGVSGSESQYEYRNGHLRHSQFPGPLTSSGTAENTRDFERSSYSNRSIIPSFAYPLPSRDLSPKDGVNNEISAYQSQEKCGGHLSYPYDRMVRDSRIYPSFTYPSTSGDGADLYSEKRTHNQVQAYQQHEEFNGDALDSNNRVIRMNERVNPAGLERNRTRKSVFSRLAMPSEERVAEKDTSPISDSESVDEVMAFLNDCHEHWVEQKKPNMSNPEAFGKPKKKKEKIRTAEVLDNDLMLPFTETTPEDLSDCEENVEHSAQKRSFIDFKRRSKAQKSPGNPSQGCELSAPQDKKRKLLRPKLIEGDSEKIRGNNGNPIENDLAPQDKKKKLLRPKLTDDESEKDRGNNGNPIENDLASQDKKRKLLRRKLTEDESEKDRGNNDNPIESDLASKSASEVPNPVNDLLGRGDQ